MWKAALWFRIRYFGSGSSYFSQCGSSSFLNADSDPDTKFKKCKTYLRKLFVVERIKKVPMPLLKRNKPFFPLLFFNFFLPGSAYRALIQTPKAARGLADLVLILELPLEEELLLLEQEVVGRVPLALLLLHLPLQGVGLGALHTRKLHFKRKHILTPGRTWESVLYK